MRGGGFRAPLRLWGADPNFRVKLKNAKLINVLTSQTLDSTALKHNFPCQKLSWIQIGERDMDRPFHSYPWGGDH